MTIDYLKCKDCGHFTPFINYLGTDFQCDNCGRIGEPEVTEGVAI